MTKQAEINLLTYILEHMDLSKDSPDREKFCVNFDSAYERDKAFYKELTGKEWEGKQMKEYINWSFAYVQQYKAKGFPCCFLIPIVWVFGKLKEIAGRVSRCNLNQYTNANTT